jgi:hypothetical protein
MTNFRRVEIILIINNVFYRVIFLVQIGFILCIKASYDTSTELPAKTSNGPRIG